MSLCLKKPGVFIMNCTETNCINNVKCSFRMEEFMSKNFKIDLDVLYHQKLDFDLQIILEDQK